MKKVLLSTAALATLALAMPASAQEESGVKLDLGGHFKGYGVYVDQDEAGTTGEARSMDIVRETEVHFGGETTLDNGLTVGAHIEATADQGDSFGVDESYAYFSGSWGRVNFGSEDGAAFLLQVAAPSADSNYDGVRQYVSAINYTSGVIGASQNTALSELSTSGLDYEQNVSGKEDKLTYLTPVFSGFQGGLSYTPDVSGASRAYGVSTDDVTGSYGDVWDLAVRYEGEFDAVRLTAGAGYSVAGVERDATNSLTGDDRKAWNVGATVGMGAFNVGAAYTTDDQGSNRTVDDDVQNIVVGADYTTGPFTLGVSYLNRDDKVGTQVDTDRYTAGVVYSYGPGMTFRGTISNVDHDIKNTSNDVEGTSVMLGTQVNF
jgi:outer membrane protein OmpU